MRAPLLLLLSLTVGATALSQRVAVVTGASRGIGKAIAVALGEQGFAVYALARSSRTGGRAESPDARALPEGVELSVEATAEAITAAGGRGIALRCDIGDDADLERALRQVADEEKRLDVLVCSAYSTPPGKLRGPFWEQGMPMWDAVNGVGLRSVFAACTAAVPLMIETRKAQPSAGAPLICLVSSFGGKSYTFNVPYGVGKAAIDRLALDMGYQLKAHGVATTALYPGLVQTEANREMVRLGTWDEASGGLDLSGGETPALSGRAVAALTALPAEDLLERSGSVEVVAELAKEFGFAEDDGSVPPSIRSLRYLLPNFVFPAIEKDAGQPVPAWVRDNVPDVLLPWSVFSSGPPPEMDNR